MRSKDLAPDFIRRYIAPYPALVHPRLKEEDYFEVLSISFGVGEFGIPEGQGLEIISIFRKTFTDSYLLRKVYVDFWKIEEGSKDSIRILAEKEIAEEPVTHFIKYLRTLSIPLISGHEDVLFDGGLFALRAFYKGTMITIDTTEPSTAPVFDEIIKQSRKFLKDLRI